MRWQSRRLTLAEHPSQVMVLPQNLRQVWRLLLLRRNHRGGACLRHRLEHEGSHSRILCLAQSTCGRCFAIQGCPRTTGECGVSMIRREISSWWLPEIFIRRGRVAFVMRPSRCPLRELATRGLDTSTSGTPHWAATVASRNLSSAPESRSAEVFWARPAHSRVTGRQVRRQLEESSWNAPPSDPRFTSGRCLLTDTVPRSDLPLRSRNTPSPSSGARTPLARPWSGPPSWPQTCLWGLMVGSDGLRSGVVGGEEVVGDAGRGAVRMETWLALRASDPPVVRRCI